jgi:FG-GAP-like repeat
VDFDGDGIPDLVSGSYDPGELYLFRGLGKCRFAAREVIRDKSGKPILKVPNQKDKIESFGSWMAMVDWEDKGKLDILVGTFDGMMFLRRNEGTRAKPVYSDKNEWVKVGDKRLRVPGGEHANPVIADWDGDGLWDIITGSAEGGVYWYRNIGKRGQPRFAPPVALAPKHEGIGYGELMDDKDQPRPGIRTQIAVVDYDGDGKLDLLVGDFCSYLHLRKDLTLEERKKFEAVRQKRDSAVTHLRASMDQLRDGFKKAMVGVPKSEWNMPENSAKWQKMYQGMKESAAYKKVNEEYEGLEKEIQAFVDKGAASQGKSLGADPSVAHGYVWLFRRK